MSSARIRDHLAAFGLSRKEIETYLAILRRGEATTGDVADAADVSQGYVYEVAEALADRGLVSVDESANPTVLRARPPGEAVGELSTRLTELESAVENVYNQSEQVEAGFEVVRSRQSVERRIERHVADAIDEVFVVLPAPTFGRMRGALADAVERGVFVYCLLVGPDLESVVADEDDFGEVARVLRTWDARAPVFVLRDAAAGVIGSRGALTDRHGDSYAVAFNQPEVAGGFYGDVMGNVWSMADERFVADPVPLPNSFDHFRNGVTTAAQHVQAGRELVADLRVRDVETGGERTFSDAPVVAARQNLVEPTTSSFPVENSLVIEVDGETASVGGDYSGFGPYYEDFAAVNLRLLEAD